MSTIWYKLWFDLWQNKSRTALAVLSVAAGVFAIGAIFGMIDQLLRQMDDAHRAVNPSHINLILRDLVDDDVVDDLRELDGVAGIDPVNQVAVRYKTEPDAEWELGTLVMRPDYNAQTYDEVILRQGQWPDENSIGVERLSSQHYGVDLGDTVIFERGDEELRYEADGLIRHPFVEPPAFGGQAHFFAGGAILTDFGVPEGRYGQLLVRVDDYGSDRAQEIAGDIRAALADRGYGVQVTLYQDPERHWGRMFVEGINVVLQVMAVVSLFMSVILVLNTMTAVITQQTDQIGVIKAIGGGRGHVMRLYLALASVFGLLALLIGMPLGATFAFGMSRWFLNLFNVEVTQFQISSQALLLQVVAALGTPLLAALWPVSRGARISVREAIASYGLNGSFGNNRFDRAVERLGLRILPTMHAAALGNLLRRKGRLILTQLVLVTGGVMFLVVMSLISSTNLTLDNEMARQQYDVRIGFTGAAPVDQVLDVVDDYENTATAQVWYAQSATILREGERMRDSAGLGAQLTGIPAGPLYEPIITTGRWLTAGDRNSVVLSAETAESNDIAVGNTITLDLGNLGSAEWEVVGTYRVIYGTGFVTEPIYAPRAAVLEAYDQPELGTTVLVRTGAATLAAAEEDADQLKELLDENGIDINPYSTTVKLEERAFADNQFQPVISMLLSLAMLVGSVGAIGLAGALGISVVERTREIGVLRAIGARSRAIMSMFILEGLSQGLLSWLIAVPLALLAAEPLAQLLGRTMLEVALDYAFNWGAVAIWLATILSMTLVASLAPARRATRISVRESLAYA